MYDIVTSLVINLNQVEVHGERNLALLYNCIDTLKQLQAAYRKPQETTKTEEASENAVTEMAVEVK